MRNRLCLLGPDLTPAPRHFAAAVLLLTILFSALMPTAAAQVAPVAGPAPVTGRAPASKPQSGADLPVPPNDPATWRNWYSAHGAEKAREFNKGDVWSVLGNN